MGHASERMVTNLGDVPYGMSFLDATRATRDLRRYTINPGHRSQRLTICETMREVWRMGERIGGADGAALQELAAAGFDYGKRMDARMRDLREMVEALGDTP